MRMEDYLKKLGLKLSEVRCIYSSPDFGQKVLERFALPPHLTLKNFEDLDLGKMDKDLVPMASHDDLKEPQYLVKKLMSLCLCVTRRNISFIPSQMRICSRVLQRAQKHEACTMQKN